PAFAGRARTPTPWGVPPALPARPVLPEPAAPREGPARTTSRHRRRARAWSGGRHGHERGAHDGRDARGACPTCVPPSEVGRREADRSICLWQRHRVGFFVDSKLTYVLKGLPCGPYALDTDRLDTTVP